MLTPMLTHVVHTPIGSFQLQFTDRGLRALTLGAARSSARRPLPAGLRRHFARYAAGQPVDWNVPLDWSGGTTFQRKVWRVLQRIPHGETRSYGWVARQLGKPRAARAVGAACGANPIPVIVPCHRVVASDGSLGGFSAGLVWKRRLLKLEQNGASR